MSRTKSSPKEYHFDARGLGGGRVDRANGIIHDVSLITAGVKARGHELHTDHVTLKQMEGCATARGKVPVKLNHQSGVENVCGYVTNVRHVGEKLLGDWHLLKSHDQYEAMMEKAERMPECFGLSAAFMGEGEKKDGKHFARCTELIAVDCVAQPAANPSGLFDATGGQSVDNKKGDMSDLDPNAVPADMPAWFKPFADQLTAIATAQKQQGDYLSGLQQQQIAQEILAMSPEDRAALTDDELSQWGITRAEIAEIEAMAAEMTDTGTEGAAATGTEGATGAAAATAAAPGRSGTVPAGPGQGNTAPAIAALQAEIKKLKNFQAGIEREKLTELEAAQTAERDAAITSLEEKTEALLVELAAKEEVIKRFEQTGGRLVSASREGVNLFSVKKGDKNASEYQILCSARFEELKEQNKGADAKKLIALEAQAVRDTIRNHKQAFHDHRAGSVTLERK